MLLERFHLNGHIAELIHQPTQKWEIPTKKIVRCESIGKEVAFECHTEGFCLQTQK